MAQKEVITLSEACSILSISNATGRNWIRSGILKPINSQNQFYKSEIIQVKEDIENNKIDRLNKRRNKKHVSGKFIHKKYINDSKGIELVENIIDDLEEEDIDDKLVQIILAEYSLKFFFFNKTNNNLDGILLNKESIKNERIYKFIDDFFLETSIDNADLEMYTDKFQDVLEHNVFKLEEDVLGLLYMSLSSTANRKQNGVYYTPTKVVNLMVDNFDGIVNENHSVVDPCSGTGNFLIEFIRRGHPATNIYGYDIDFVSIFIAKMNVIIFSKADESYYDKIDSNIKQTNSLHLLENQNKFDICVGNPPWGSELDDDSILYSSFHYETYTERGLEAFSLFIELGLKIIKEDGYLSYIVPETLLSVKTHEPIRELISRLSNFKQLKYWGNVFDGVLAPAVSFITKKEETQEFGIGSTVYKEDNSFYTIGNNRSILPDNWDFNISDSELSIIDRLENLSDLEYMRDNSDFALGIVTGNNKKFIKQEKESPEHSIIVRGSDVFKFKIKKPTNYILYEPEKFQQVARNNLYFEEEKLLYRFISDTLVFAYDNEKTLSLNSANVVVPKIRDINIKYVLGILNSKISHFYFKLKFNSIKILRNHIESIPIKKSDEKTMIEVIGLVDKLIVCEDDAKLDVYYEELNNLIYRIYEFTNDEKDIVNNFYDGNIFLK